MSSDLTIFETPIAGLLLIKLPVHGDHRGWFKENWQREKMVALGLPDFGPVQHNISSNERAGTTRGIHAEPWDKFVSLASGRIFGAWVDLREGPSFGTTFTAELDPGTASFVPRGVGNAYQTLENHTTYSYLVNDHWRADAEYKNLDLADETVAINWPIPLDQAVLSDNDKAHPRLADVVPMSPLKTLILGANGQLGRALQLLLPEAEAAARAEIDLADPRSLTGLDWPDYDTIINAAAYTNVDEAESPQGRREAWAVNVTAVARLARIATAHQLTLVQISTDYVFDGTVEEHDEDEPFSPLGVYGQTKAAGDAVVSTVPRHYIVRTSWLMGDGHNFIRTMERLADDGAHPNVVNDQFGRVTYADDLAHCIAGLVASRAPYGTYNLTGGGPIQSWDDIARTVFTERGRDPSDVVGVSTEEWVGDRRLSPRPMNSSLSLAKVSRARQANSDPDA